MRPYLAGAILPWHKYNAKAIARGVQQMLGQKIDYLHGCVFTKLSEGVAVKRRRILPLIPESPVNDDKRRNDHFFIEYVSKC